MSRHYKQVGDELVTLRYVNVILVIVYWTIFYFLNPIKIVSRYLYLLFAIIIVTIIKDRIHSWLRIMLLNWGCFLVANIFQVVQNSRKCFIIFPISMSADLVNAVSAVYVIASPIKRWFDIALEAFSLRLTPFDQFVGVSKKFSFDNPCNPIT